MPGQIRRTIDTILLQRAKGNPTIILTTKTKLILKGVDPDRFTAASPDDGAVLAKLRIIAADFGVRL
jgi:hypothetical protein